MEAFVIAHIGNPIRCAMVGAWNIIAFSDYKARTYKTLWLSLLCLGILSCTNVTEHHIDHNEIQTQTCVFEVSALLKFDIPYHELVIVLS